MKAILKKQTPLGMFNPFVPIDLTEKKRLLEKLINILNSSLYEEDVKNVLFNSYFSKLLYLVRKDGSNISKNSNIGIQTLPETNNVKSQTKFFKEMKSQTDFGEDEDELPPLENTPQDKRYKKVKSGFSPPGVPTSPAFQLKGQTTPNVTNLGARPKGTITPRISITTPNEPPKRMNQNNKKNEKVIRRIFPEKNKPIRSPPRSEPRTTTLRSHKVHNAYVEGMRELENQKPTRGRKY